MIEVILNLEYLYLRHTSPRSERQKSKSGVLRYHGHAPLVGFASALMTLSKTALYWLQGKFLPLLDILADRQNGIVGGVWLGITRLPSSGACGRRRMGE